MFMCDTFRLPLLPHLEMPLVRELVRLIWHGSRDYLADQLVQ